MILIVTIAGIVGIVSVQYLGQNNPVEKVAEEIIKEETGITLDLTPSTSPASTSSKSTTSQTPNSLPTPPKTQQNTPSQQTP